MQSSALLRYERIAQRKVRVVAKLVRGKKVDVAINTLMFCAGSAAQVLKKLLV